MAQGRFTAQIEGWIAEKKALRDAVYREAAQRVVEIMQTPQKEGGNLRVKTGFLRASLHAALGDALPVVTDRPSDEVFYSYDAGEVNLVIAGASADDVITVAYAARYARPREYGSRGQPGDAFVRLASQQWGRVVQEVVTEARARSGT